MTTTAQDLLALRKARVDPAPADLISYLGSRTKAQNTDLLNLFNPAKHSEDAQGEVGRLIFSVLQSAKYQRPAAFSSEASEVLLDLILKQAALDSGDSHGPTMNEIRPLVQAVTQGRCDSSQLVTDLLNPDKVSPLNEALEAKRIALLGDPYPKEMNAMLDSTNARPTVVERYACRLVLATCLAPAAAHFLSKITHNRDKVTCPQAREILLRTPLGIRLQDAIDNKRTLKDIE